MGFKVRNNPYYRIKVIKSNRKWSLRVFENDYGARYHIQCNKCEGDAAMALNEEIALAMYKAIPRTLRCTVCAWNDDA